MYKFRKFEVVGRKKCPALGFLRQFRGNGCRQTQTVGRGSAAPDFVHEDKRMLRRLVQDCRGFGHFHHESRAPVRQVIGGADACEDFVNRSDAGGFSRNKRAGVR